MYFFLQAYYSALQAHTKKKALKHGPHNARLADRYSVYLLYWYKSTNTDTCVSLTADNLSKLQCSLYLFYWYKRANTDAKGALTYADSAARDDLSQLLC